jgi:hypothetical protein
MIVNSGRTPGQKYGRQHQQLRREWEPRVALGGVKCARCRRPIALGEKWDLGHLDSDPSKYAGPEHLVCNRQTNPNIRGRQPNTIPPLEDPDAERDGLDAKDRRWKVPWLEVLQEEMPADAVWPRLMTIPHPRATGSLGAEFAGWVLERSGAPLRWWQELAATRLLEHDDDERLVWETAVLSTARQVGKSWFLRELCLWRIHQGARFGEPQDVMHTGKDLAVCKEVQRPARVWAKGRRDAYKVTEVNGQEQIEFLGDASRWMLRAKEAVYGYSVSLGVVDEGWKVRASSVDEGLTPTMAEREQPQLLLVSTAHRRATALMLGRRQVALAGLEEGDGDLLVEWSAPAHVELDDRKAWRLASPHWSDRRERLIRKRYEATLAGEVEDPDEADPVESFRAQWLNQWPRKVIGPDGPMEPLLPADSWASLVASDVAPSGGVWVAIEDDFGLGAGVACARRLVDGRLELDGWLRGDWDSAIGDVEDLAKDHQVRRLLVGASLMDRLPAGLVGLAESRGSTEVRIGLALLRDLAATGQVVHDANTTDLDTVLEQAMVREGPAGLVLFAKGDTHLVRAAVWALAAAHKRSRVPVIR